jgi:3-oxoacyl-[acyl-carrier-protein] synthase-1
MHDLDFRIGDLSGEQYYFKEASLAMSRILRVRKEELSLWHQAECIGECGAASGVASIVVANAACVKGYAPGPSILCHSANDSGQRAAAIFEYRLSS